jgi:hypothetical protein
LEVEKLIRLLIWKFISYDKEQFAPEKNLLLLSKVKLPKLDTNLEKLNCDQCYCTNSPEKGLT